MLDYILVWPLALCYTALITCIFKWILYKTENSLKTYSLWFSIQCAFMAMSTLIALHWLFSGTPFAFNYNYEFWNIYTVLEKGSLDALSSTASIIGIGSILLAWTYKERDTITLGKPQIEMIHLKYGRGYGLSLVLHFSATALCILAAECGAKETAMWAFVTLLSGCIPHAAICLWITWNRGKQEKLALELWEQDIQAAHGSFQVIQNMIVHLEHTEVRNHRGYRKKLSEAILKWLECRCENSEKIAEEDINMGSMIFREIAVRASESDRELFEEEIIRTICDLQNTEDNPSPTFLLLCCSFYRFLYIEKPEKEETRLRKIKFYSSEKEPNKQFECFIGIITEFSIGVEWYNFLMEGEKVPGISCGRYKQEPVANAFEALICSIAKTDLSAEAVSDMAKTAWLQI